ncbi:MAG: hypothetical protein F6K48_02735 [Okeania sp. SIO3H1]|uniref:hypothetical protein n=1 Tax=Okeania sp. SIO1I7 TaxID=2607772 RepID=UPI0013C55CB8|nr:hypothetical protein [Okeania sp. SIO1I7]NEN87878.1 hypothetical protein [Okeania sp. SIO3H1]
MTFENLSTNYIGVDKNQEKKPLNFKSIDFYQKSINPVAIMVLDIFMALTFFPCLDLLLLGHTTQTAT